MNKINFLEKLSLAEGVHIPDSAWNLIQEAKITSDFEQVFILSKAKKDIMPFQVEYDLKVFIALLEYAHIGKVCC